MTRKVVKRIAYSFPGGLSGVLHRDPDLIPMNFVTMGDRILLYIGSGFYVDPNSVQIEYDEPRVVDHD